MKKYFLFLFFISVFYTSIAQISIIDSIDFYKFHSSTILLHAPTEKLFFFMGSPQSFLLKQNLPWSHNNEYKSSSCNSFLFYKKQNLVYWDYRDTSYLHAIKIKNSDYIIHYENFCFDKNTLIEDVIEYFQIPFERIDTIPGIMAPYKIYKKSVYYLIVFTSLGICNNEIYLYFNRKGYLVYMHFYMYR